ncbi:hypothetical protein Y888_04425 [Mixta calida B021323]|nr:hypothetical protein Y888_04425 [Mixta calida B021323]
MAPAQEDQSDRKDAKTSSLTARPAPSLAWDALLPGLVFLRLKFQCSLKAAFRRGGN